MAFGSLSSIDRLSFWQLPEAMQVDGIRLAIEFGAKPAEIAKLLRMDADDVVPMARQKLVPFRRLGEEPVPGGRGI